jgi:hypothetical protein
MSEPYQFAGGYPTPETVERAFAEADLNRAVSAYRFFYPTVSFEATWRGNLSGGVVPNKVFPLLEARRGSWCSRPTPTRPIPRWRSICRPARSCWNCRQAR